MAKSFQFAAVVAVLLALCGNALGGKTCFFVDGDCKPNPSGLPAGAKGDAATWVKLLQGFQSCVSKTAAACTGNCMVMPGKGCTLTLQARKATLGSLAPTFAQCNTLAPAACAANVNCKVGTGSTCVIAAPGIASTFGLKTNFPAATSILVNCKTLVGDPAKCNAA